ncbi:hypothetical protein A2619_03695 [candidate division WWE3 bacterium RIFOXYD1_FULL_39_9]|nr:MAG: hypothetical protein A2619_03695 [candidate division WWE3 bacterium RIFOXYD1_FULL_39_9]
MLKNVVKELGIPINDAGDKMELYTNARNFFIRSFKKKYSNFFQSPSVLPSVISQRSGNQSDLEHSVYQRSDYTPISLETSLNGYFPDLGSVKSTTLMFSSGMAAVSSLVYFLYGKKGVSKIDIGKNSYFETKWLIEDYRRVFWFNEYALDIEASCSCIWTEYPINCTQPGLYPFSSQMNLSRLFKKSIEMASSTRRQTYLVIDYTLGFLPFDVALYLDKLPENLTVFLVTSLQKHRGYGFDLTNAGAVTIYSHHLKEDREYLDRVRAITGSLVTQETVWLMPQINPTLINKLVHDSGQNAHDIFYKLKDVSSQVRVDYADSKDFYTSFIYLTISPEMMKRSVLVPYYSDLLVKEIIQTAKRKKTVIVQGTSFGFPFTRIFKNSERYENTNSLRVAIGYDEEMTQGVAESLEEGINNFVNKYGE